MGSESNSAFWDHVRKELKRRGLLQEDLANAIGVKHVVVRLWFSRNTPPSASNAVKIARFLETTVEQLLADTPTETMKRYAMGQRIAESMGRKGYDLDALSEMTMIPPSRIRDYLHRGDPPEIIQDFVQLSKWLDVSLEYLVGLRWERNDRLNEITRLAMLLGDEDQVLIESILQTFVKSQSKANS